MDNKSLYEPEDNPVPFEDNEGSFDRCDFLLNKNNKSVVIIVPEYLPKEESLSLEVRGKDIVFCLGDEDYAVVPVRREDIIERLSKLDQVGIIESKKGMPDFPAYITAVANVKNQRENKN